MSFPEATCVFYDDRCGDYRVGFAYTDVSLEQLEGIIQAARKIPGIDCWGPYPNMLVYGNMATVFFVAVEASVEPTRAMTALRELLRPRVAIHISILTLRVTRCHHEGAPHNSFDAQYKFLAGFGPESGTKFTADFFARAQNIRELLPPYEPNKSSEIPLLVEAVLGIFAEMGATVGKIECGFLSECC